MQDNKGCEVVRGKALLCLGSLTMAALATLSGSVILVETAAATESGHAAGYWKSCPPKMWNSGTNPSNENQGPRNDKSLPIANVRAHAMSCAAVHRAISHGTIKIHCCGAPPPGSFWAHFRTRGFRCHGPDPIKCKGGRRRFKFNWGE